MRSSCRRPISIRLSLVHRSGTTSLIRKQTYVADAPGRAARRGVVLGLPAGRRHPDRVSARRGNRRPARVERRVTDVEDQHARRSRAVQTPGFLSLRACCCRAARRPAISTPARSRASCAALDPAHRGRRARRAAACAAAGGQLLDDYRGLAVTGLTECDPQAAASLRRPARQLVDARARRAAGRAGRDRFLRIQLPARAPRSSGSAFRSSITSARRSGRGGPAGSKTMRAIADRVLVIFPFEEAIYRAGRRAGRVRRPSADRSDEAVDVRATRFSRRLGLDPSAPTVAMLPGSRPNEVRAHPADAGRRRATDSQRVSRRPVRGRAGAASGRSRSFDALSAPSGGACHDRRRRYRHGARRRRRGADRVRHGDRAGGAARHADGRRLPDVAADVPARPARREGRHDRRWSI